MEGLSTNSDTIQKLGLRLELPVEFDHCLRDDCRGAIHGDWADNLVKKLVVEGWAGCADPAISIRQAYYALTADADGPKPGFNQRYPYMTASARIEEAIPGEVLGLMKRTGYVSIYRWDGVKRDLYALIVLVDCFMEAYAKVSSDFTSSRLTKLMTPGAIGLGKGTRSSN